ncbi:MAG TPA: protein kinase [Thermomicrobiales bacterium]|nr:protein kinase [Thermomicrobiales bacterium]
MSDDTRDFRSPDEADRDRPWERDGAPSPRRLAGRYEVLEEIGSGATAITYRGRDRRLNRYVAIKIMRQDPGLDQSFVQRFEREARTAASVSHGNVVDVYDVGQEAGQLYIVMQYIDGEDLKHLITSRGALPLDRAREISRQVLAGVGAIHAAGIVHRDIKPQNVLIGRDGIARVTDFGIAQAAMDSGLTTAGTTVGTAAYMAPEQAQGGQVTEASDLYSVGVMLYEMLTGVMPFDSPTPMGMMLAHIQQQPVPPSERNGRAGIPAELDGIVLQAMAKDPRDRFRTASAMSRALESVSGTSSRTTVLPGMVDAGRTARVNGFAPAADGRPIQLVRSDARRVGVGLRGVLGGLLLLLLLGAGGAAGYMMYGMVGQGDGENLPTEEATTVPAAVDPTATGSATQAITEVPDEATDEPDDVTATATEEPARPTATSVPTRVPTREPTAAPAVVPTTRPPTATEIAPVIEPTDAPPVPTERPTDVPIDELPTNPPSEDDPAQIIVPIDGQDGSGGDGSGDDDQNGDDDDDSDEGVIEPLPGTSGNGQPAAVNDSSRIQTISSSQGNAVTGQGTTLDIETKDWRGDGSRHDKDEDWVVVSLGSSATASFDLKSLPAGEEFAVEIALAVTGPDQLPLTVLVNDQELGTYDGSLPVLIDGASGDQLGSLRVTLPTAPLERGKNRITVVYGTVADESEGDDDSGSGGNSGRGNRDDVELPENALLLASSTITIDPVN